MNAGILVIDDNHAKSALVEYLLRAAGHAPERFVAQAEQLLAGPARIGHAEDEP